MLMRTFYFISFATLLVLGMALGYFIMAPAFDEFGVIETLLSMVCCILAFGMCHLSLKMYQVHEPVKDQLEMKLKCKR